MNQWMTTLFFGCYQDPPISSQVWFDIKVWDSDGKELDVQPLRVILLMMLVVCLNGTILLEQPANSFLEYFPRFRDFLQLLQNTGGDHAVTCIQAKLLSDTWSRCIANKYVVERLPWGHAFQGCPKKNHHLPLPNSPIPRGLGDESEIAKPRSIECVGGWLTMMGLPPNAMWRFQIRVPFDT